MIQLKKSFRSENNMEVVLELRKINKGVYEIMYIVPSASNADGDTIGYLTEGSKIGNHWLVSDANLDNFEKDYQGVKYKTLTELINYIGKIEIENGEWFNFY